MVLELRVHHLAACTDMQMHSSITPACTNADMVHGLQIHLQRLALSAGHTAYKERLEELQTLKLHLKNASREVRLALHTRQGLLHISPPQLCCAEVCTAMGSSHPGAPA